MALAMHLTMDVSIPLQVLVAGLPHILYSLVLEICRVENESSWWERKGREGQTRHGVVVTPLTQSSIMVLRLSALWDCSAFTGNLHVAEAVAERLEEQMLRMESHPLQLKQLISAKGCRGFS